MRLRRWIGAVIVAVAVPGGAFAQYQADGRPIGSRGGVAGSGLYVAPELNPFFNPALTQQTYDRDALLFYFLSAQSARGGIGSGRLSGLHAPAVTGQGRGRAAAEMPRSSSVPGAGAAGYFGRGPAAADRVPYSGRHNRYFNNNGR